MQSVSVLFNEPKLLKSGGVQVWRCRTIRFSALQRAEIAEIALEMTDEGVIIRVSVLFNEPKLLKYDAKTTEEKRDAEVSVLFNEPKLLKYSFYRTRGY